MIKNFDTALFAGDDILFLVEDSGNVIFCSDEIGILNIDLNNINLDCVNFDEDDSETMIHVRFMAWNNKLEQRKPFKKDIRKELIPAA